MQPSQIISPADKDQVYYPREDSFLLLEAVKSEIHEGFRVLEVGTGSGFICSSINNLKYVFATEINPHAALVSYKAGVSVVRCNLMDALKGRFDLILFNPPYIPTRPEERISDWLEYALDGGEDGLEVAREFLIGAGSHLSKIGRILILISSRNIFDKCHQMFTDYGYDYELVTRCFCEDMEELQVYKLTPKNQKDIY